MTAALLFEFITAYTDRPVSVAQAVMALPKPAVIAQWSFIRANMRRALVILTPDDWRVHGPASSALPLPNTCVFVIFDSAGAPAGAHANSLDSAFECSLEPRVQLPCVFDSEQLHTCWRTVANAHANANAHAHIDTEQCAVCEQEKYASVRKKEVAGARAYYVTNTPELLAVIKHYNMQSIIWNYQPRLFEWISRANWHRTSAQITVQCVPHSVLHSMSHGVTHDVSHGVSQPADCANLLNAFCNNARITNARFRSGIVLHCARMDVDDTQVHSTQVHSTQVHSTLDSLPIGSIPLAYKDGVIVCVQPDWWTGCALPTPQFVRPFASPAGAKYFSLRWV